MRGNKYQCKKKVVLSCAKSRSLLVAVCVCVCVCVCVWCMCIFERSHVALESISFSELGMSAVRLKVSALTQTQAAAEPMLNDSEMQPFS